MLILSSEKIRALVSMPELIGSLERAFASDSVAPPRQVVRMPGGTGNRLFLAMPAFASSGTGIAKLATVVPDNKARGLPSIQAVIVVFSDTGTPTAMLDGTTVTQLRTGAASALASKYLSRTNSSHLVIIGTGALVPSMAAAHCAVRPIRTISVWGRRLEAAEAVASALRERIGGRVEVVVPSSIEEAASTADIISCATSSPAPVLFGKWLRPGTFVDLVGSFSPSKRESDDEVLVRSRIFVDTFEGALSEAGDILDPMARGVISRDRVEGELADLVRARVVGRVNEDEIITFKSVGTAIEDLAAAEMILAAVRRDIPTKLPDSR